MWYDINICMNDKSVTRINIISGTKQWTIRSYPMFRFLKITWSYANEHRSSRLQQIHSICPHASHPTDTLDPRQKQTTLPMTPPTPVTSRAPLDSRLHGHVMVTSPTAMPSARAAGLQFAVWLDRHVCGPGAELPLESIAVPIYAPNIVCWPWIVTLVSQFTFAIANEEWIHFRLPLDNGQRGWSMEAAGSCCSPAGFRLEYIAIRKACIFSISIVRWIDCGCCLVPAPINRFVEFRRNRCRYCCYHRRRRPEIKCPPESIKSTVWNLFLRHCKTLNLSALQKNQYGRPISLRHPDNNQSCVRSTKVPTVLMPNLKTNEYSQH